MKGRQEGGTRAPAWCQVTRRKEKLPSHETRQCAGMGWAGEERDWGTEVDTEPLHRDTAGVKGRWEEQCPATEVAMCWDDR